MPARRRVRKHHKRRAPRRGRKVARRGKANLKQSNQRCTLVETLEFIDHNSNSAYFGSFNLAQFFRATTVAKNFQFYRAKSVKWVYQPLYNTFQENNSGSAVAKPQIYVQMNRTQNNYFNSLTGPRQLQALQQNGCQPKQFVRNHSIQYKPNWCSSGLTAYTLNDADVVSRIASQGLRVNYGWLATANGDAYRNPASSVLLQNPVPGTQIAENLAAGVMYNGHIFFCEQENNPSIPVCKVIATVEWEFKGAQQNYASYTLAEQTPAKPLVLLATAT